MLKDSHLANSKESDFLLCGTYTITHSMSKEIYVGSTSSFGMNGFRKCGFIGRFRNHFGLLKRGKHHAKYLQNVVNKYGTNGLRFNIVKICDPEASVREEQKLIDLLKPKFNTVKKAKSTIGFKHSEEAKRKMSIAKRGRKLSKEHCEIIRHHAKKNIKGRNLDYLRSEKVNKKRAESLRGRKRDSSYLNKEVVQLTVDDKVVANYKSIKEASEKTGIERSRISRVLIGSRKKVHGFKWRYALSKK